MNQDFQKILMRAVLVFTAVFVVVFWSFQTGQGSYSAQTTMVLVPRDTATAAQIDTLVANMNVLFSEDAFHSRVADALYAQSETWKPFSLSVKNPAGSVFVFLYQDDSTDPYALRESMRVVREQVFMAVSRQYDISRNLSVLFLDNGKVVESGDSMLGLGWAVGIGVLGAGILEVLLWGARRRREDTLVGASLEQHLETRVAPEVWWKDLQRKGAVPTYAGETEEQETYSGDEGYMQKSEPAPVPENKESRFVAFERREDMPKPVRKMIVGAAPENLPIMIVEEEATNNQHSSEASYDDQPTGVNKEDKGTSSLEEKEEEDNAKNSGIPETLPGAYDSVRVVTPAQPLMGGREEVVNPEPSSEELKRRLNKLLRGEL